MEICGRETIICVVKIIINLENKPMTRKVSGLVSIVTIGFLFLFV